MFLKKTPQIIGIIPARFASTRLPGKPLLPILGKSLIQRTWENAKRFKELNNLVVATDDERIFDHVKAFGGKVVMTSNECNTGTDRLAEVIRNHKEFESCDYVFNIQGDEPCLDPSIVASVTQILVNDPEAVMSTAAVPFYSEEEALNPSVVKCVMDLKGNALYFSRSLIPHHRGKVFDPASNNYYRHLGVYCYTPDFLLNYEALAETPLQKMESLEQLKVLEHGYRIKIAVITEQNESVGVDTLEDIKKLERILVR